MAKTQVSDELWAEFHRVVNMTSRELAEWLRADSSSETAEALPRQAGPATGRHVLAILGKRRADVTDDDVVLMECVVDRIHVERRADLESTAGDQAWRHRLMSIGHDPLSIPRWRRRRPSASAVEPVADLTQVGDAASGCGALVAGIRS